MMTAVYYSLNRHIKLGANCLKSLSRLTNQSWGFAPICWSATFQNPSPRVIPHSHKEIPESQPILADTLVAQYLKKDVIPWEKVKTTILSSDKLGVKEAELNMSVFQSCLNLNLLDVAISYYKDVLSKGGKFSMLEYSLLLKLLAKNSLELPGKYEDVLRELFQIFFPHFKSFTVLQLDFLIVFCTVKDLWSETVKLFEEDFTLGDSFFLLKYLISAAFKFDEVQLGWRLLYKNPMAFSSECFKTYMDYCIRMAETDKFSVSMINDLVDYCQESVTVIPYTELYDSLVTLVSILNKSPNKKYHWTVNKSLVNHKSYCSVCNLKLNSVKITEADYNELKSYILNDVIISDNCYIRTSHKEVENFLSFLKNCSDYDLVIDGLNVSMKRNIRVKQFENVFEFLTSQGKNCLLIAKKHLKKHPVYSTVRKNCQVFLTDNLSDDDVFVIYATLYGGMNTQFLTGDFYRGYSKYIKNENFRRIFIKWLLSHQNFVPFIFKGLSVAGHSFLSQSTSVPSSLGEKKHLSWHLSSQKSNTPKLQASDDFYWVCLKAKPI